MFSSFYSKKKMFVIIAIAIAVHFWFVDADFESKYFHLPCGQGIKPAYQPFEVSHNVYLLSCLLGCDDGCIAATYLPEDLQTQTWDGTGTCSYYNTTAVCQNGVKETAVKWYEKSGAATYNPCLNGGNWMGSSCNCVGSWVGTRCERLARDCSEIYTENPSSRSQSYVNYLIKPHGWPNPFKVSCQVEWGGLTILMRRAGYCNSVDFNTTWVHYKHGFGDLDFVCEFWLGLEQMHAITAQRNYQLEAIMILQEPSLLVTSAEEYVQAFYSNFWISNETEKYKVHMTSYFKNFFSNNEAGDSMFLNYDPTESVVGQPFSTFDSDNDKSVDNCAQLYGGGWWFNDCTVGYLTGTMVKTPTGMRDKTQKSLFWKYNLDDYVINIAEIKIKAIP